MPSILEPRRRAEQALVAVVQEVSVCSRERSVVGTRLRLDRPLVPRAVPLLTAALLVGLDSAAYWTFAVEHLTAAGALSS